MFSDFLTSFAASRLVSSDGLFKLLEELGEEKGGRDSSHTANKCVSVCVCVGGGSPQVRGLMEACGVIKDGGRHGHITSGVFLDPVKVYFLIC